MTETRRKRRKFLVHRGIQYRFIVWVVLLMVVFAAAASWVVYYITWSQILRTANLTGQTDKLFVHITEGFFWSIITTLVVGGGLGAVIALLASHKIAGPVYRLQKVAQDLAKGSPVEEIRIRKGDELQEMAGEFNQIINTVNKLRQQSESLRGKLKKIKEEIEKDPAATTVSKKKLEELLEER